MMVNSDGNHTMSADDFLQRMNNYTAPDPSPRNPRISTHSSHADRIEASYLADNHRTWGFVIYRTTYEDEIAWNEFMRRLKVCTTENMDFYNGQDVLDRMTWTVFDDRERFEGASVTGIRSHFRDWTEPAVQAEQSSGSNGAAVSMGRSPRYRYCLLVDAEALASITSTDNAPPQSDFDRDRQGWVKVISKNWITRSENPIYAGRKLEPNSYEPIDGLTEKDVGWVKCPISSVMTEFYMLFQDANGYTINYRRPPAVLGYPWN